MFLLPHTFPAPVKAHMILTFTSVVSMASFIAYKLKLLAPNLSEDLVTEQDVGGKSVSMAGHTPTP